MGRTVLYYCVRMVMDRFKVSAEFGSGTEGETVARSGRLAATVDWPSLLYRSTVLLYSSDYSTSTAVVPG